MKAVEGWKIYDLDALVRLDLDSLNEKTPRDFSFYYLDIGSTSEGKITLPSRETLFREAPSRARKIVHRRDVLMSTVRPNLKAFAYFDHADAAFIASTGFAVLTAREETDPRFILYALLSDSTSSQIETLVIGSNYPAINSGAVRRLRILTPPKPEQTKIAEILSTVDRAIEQTETLIAKQQRIKTGLMQDLLTRGIDEHGNVRSEQTHAFKDSPLGRIPVEWEVVPLGDVAEIIDPNPSHRYPPPCDLGVPIASTENFEGHNEFDLTGCDNVPRSVFEAQSKRCQYQPPDVVFARKGRLGLARPYGNAEKVFSHTVVIVKGTSTGRVMTEFLLWVLRDYGFFRQIDKRMNSNSGVPTLGVQFLAAIPILVPKPPEQRRLLQVMFQSETTMQGELNFLRKLRSLKVALMQDLLTGKRRVTPLMEAETVQ